MKKEITLGLLGMELSRKLHFTVIIIELQSSSSSSTSSRTKSAYPKPVLVN